MTKFRTLALAALAAPLTLSIAACDSTDDASDIANGEPLPIIAAPDGQAWTDIVQVSEEGGYVLGNPEAPLKLIEYASHTCGACAQFSQQSASLKADFVSTGRVSFELRNLIRDPIDLVISTLARCGQPSSFIPLADQAWADFDNVMGTASANGAAIQAAGSLPEEQRFVAIAEAAGLLDFFATRGLSKDQANVCLADIDNIKSIADRSESQSSDLGVNATPTFFLNGRKLDLNQWNDIEPMLKQAGAR